MEFDTNKKNKLTISNNTSALQGPASTGVLQMLLFSGGDGGPAVDKTS